MPSPLANAKLHKKSHVRPDKRKVFQHVMACLDRSPAAIRVLEEATSIAEQFRASLTALRVIPGSRSASPCTDPVDWELTRREQLAELQSLAETVHGARDMQTVVACGSAVSCIYEKARKCAADLLVLGSGTSSTPPHWGLGGTVRHIAETWPGSVLIVPTEALHNRRKRARIVVPVDGSSQSEAALRIASMVASERAAELVILHAMQTPVTALENRLGHDDDGLLEKLHRREQRVSEDRIQRLRMLLPTNAHRNRIRRLDGEEPRQALMRAIYEERGELVVLSARGLGRDPELPIGSTAEYLISRAVTPILLVRSGAGNTQHTAELAPTRPASARGSSNDRP